MFLGRGALLASALRRKARCEGLGKGVSWYVTAETFCGNMDATAVAVIVFVARQIRYQSTSTRYQVSPFDIPKHHKQSVRLRQTQRHNKYVSVSHGSISVGIVCCVNLEYYVVLVRIFFVLIHRNEAYNPRLR